MAKSPPIQLTRLKAFYTSSGLALRVSALANLALVAALGFTSFSLHTVKAKIADWKPLVIRVDEAGRAAPVDISVIDSPASELEIKVFSAEYVSRIQSYDPYTLNRDIGLAMTCTEETCSRQLINHFQRDPDFQALKKSGAIVQCSVTSVQILSAAPLEIQVNYNLENMQTQETRKWFAVLTARPTKRTFYNPFGLLVTGVRINTTIK